jgi:peptidoglycan hydrolase-like protein with peptidoglycan-binding domain
MAYSLTWLPAVLEIEGLKIAEVPGWQNRGRAEMGSVLGTMIHHTAGPRPGNMPSLDTLVNGRSDLPGPLANLGLGRDGTWYVIAAGRANHAGAGRWRGEVNGNSNFIGIEAENTGGPDDQPWPEVQTRCLVHGVAALLRHAGRGAEWCAGHKEYALPAGRKIDPRFDMAMLRGQIADVLSGTAPPLTPIPAEELVAPASGTPRPTVRRGSAGPFVKTLQERLGLQPADGIFGAQTEVAVREFQRQHTLVPDGIVGPRSWARVDTA